MSRTFSIEYRGYALSYSDNDGFWRVTLRRTQMHKTNNFEDALVWVDTAIGGVFEARGRWLPRAHFMRRIKR